MAALYIWLKTALLAILTSFVVFLGVDSSEDEDDDLDHELPWQRVWNDLSSDEGEGDFE